MKQELNPLHIIEYVTQKYDSVEFTLASGISDYNLRANVAGAFENLPIYTTMNIRTSQQIGIKLNSSSYRTITIPSSRPFELRELMEITNIFITNTSGVTASIYIIGVRKGVTT
jgi:hypothetical protein